MFRKANKSFVGGLRSCVFLFKRRQFIKWYERFPNNIWLFIIIMIEAWKVPKCKQHRKELYHEKIIVLIWIISTFISLVGCSSINNSEAPLPTSSSSKEINSDSKEPNSPILPTTPDDTTEPEHPSKNDDDSYTVCLGDSDQLFDFFSLDFTNTSKLEAYREI